MDGAWTALRASGAFSLRQVAGREGERQLLQPVDPALALFGKLAVVAH